MKILSMVTIALAVLLRSAPAWAGTKSKRSHNPVVLIKTSLGSIKVELDAKAAPITTKNFLRYVDEKFYNGTIFHRVIAGFMIQGGGMDKKLTEKETHEPIQNESTNGLKNTRGTIAMARRSDPNSATAQFFINVVDNGMLDYPSNGGYAVFGHVVQGMDVVDKIRAVQTMTVPNAMGDVVQTTGGGDFVQTTTAPGAMADVPVDPVVIESITRVHGNG